MERSKVAMVMGFCLVFFLGITVRRASAVPRESIYSMPGTWETDAGKKIRLKDLSGTSVVMTFAYASCKSACPLTARRLIALKKQYEDVHKRVRFVIVSLDPKTDTREALRAFRERHALEGEDWIMLRGNDSDIRTLSVLLGYSYQRRPTDAEIMHSNKVYLLDPEGVLVKTNEGLNGDLSDLVQ